MKLGDADIRPYEGLVITTASMLVRSPRVHDEFDDICQVLRLTVARAIVSYDRGKARQTVEKYVFSCVVNRKKDILDRRPRQEDSLDARLEDGGSAHSKLEARYLSDHEAGYDIAEDEPVKLPATLTAFEVRVVVLMLREYNQTAVARELNVTRQKVRDAERSIRRKMADWAPVGIRPVSRLRHPPGSEAEDEGRRARTGQRSRAEAA
jgi:DNA-directed RNA polymerase specialized sigma24 family protein